MPGTKRPLVECNNLNALGVHISIRRTSRRHLAPNGEKERKKGGKKKNTMRERRRVLEPVKNGARRTKRDRDEEKARVRIGGG